jgi:methionyl-tRNA synthetase
VQAAEAAGIAIETLVRANAARFHALRVALDLSFDDFIRTSADAAPHEVARLVGNRC